MQLGISESTAEPVPRWSDHVDDDSNDAAIAAALQSEENCQTPQPAIAASFLEPPRAAGQPAKPIYNGEIIALPLCRTKVKRMPDGKWYDFGGRERLLHDESKTGHCLVIEGTGIRCDPHGRETKARLKKGANSSMRAGMACPDKGSQHWRKYPQRTGRPSCGFLPPAGDGWSQPGPPPRGFPAHIMASYHRRIHQPHFFPHTAC